MLELIDELSHEQQQVLTLKFVFNFGNAEVATILGKTEGAVKSLQHRALVSLQKQIEQAPARPSSRLGLARGGSGRHRRASERGLDDALPRADARGGERRRARSTSAWRRSRTAARAARRGRRREEGDAGRGARRRRARAPARRCSGTCARSTRCSPCSTAGPGTRDPAADLETLKLELLVADRDHVERRLERVAKQAKSGDAKLRVEVAELEQILAHLDAGGTLAEWERRAAARARAADDEAAARGRERPGRDRRASSRRSSPSCPTRRRRRSARASPRSARSRGGCSRCSTSSRSSPRARRRRARGRCGAGGSALDAARDDPLRHRARVHPLRGDPLGRPRRRRLARRGRARQGKQRLEGKTYDVQDGDVLNIRFNV